MFALGDAESSDNRDAVAGYQREWAEALEEYTPANNGPVSPWQSCVSHTLRSLPRQTPCGGRPGFSITGHPLTTSPDERPKRSSLRESVPAGPS